MKKPAPAPEPAPRLGSVLAGEVLPLAELARRFGWGKRQSIDAHKLLGLRVVSIGKRLFTTGDWVREFIERQAEPGGPSDE